MGRLRNRIEQAFDKVKDVGNNVIDVAKDIGEGVKDVGEGAVGMAKSAAKLDFEGVGENAAKVADGVTDVAFTVVENAPIVRAADILLDGKVSKVLDAAEETVDASTESALMTIASSADGVKNGIVQTTKALSEGDFKEAARQALSVAENVASLTPMSMASTMGSVLVEQVVSKVVPGQLGDKMAKVASSVVGVGNVSEALTEGSMAVLDQTGAGEKIAQASEKLGLPPEALEAASTASERGRSAGKREAPDRAADPKEAGDRGLPDKDTATGGAEADAVESDRSRGKTEEKDKDERELALPAMTDSVASDAEAPDAEVSTPNDGTLEADAAMAMDATVNVVELDLWTLDYLKSLEPIKANESRSTEAAGPTATAEPA